MTIPNHKRGNLKISDLDLALIVGSGIVLLMFVYVVPLDPIRIFLGLPYMLLFPGYVLIAALFPRRTDLTGVERFALSLGMSLALLPLIGLVLNFTPWGIRLTPIMAGLSIWIIGFSAIAYRRRQDLPLKERATPEWHGFTAIQTWGSSAPIDVALRAVVAISIVVLIGAVAYRTFSPTVGESFTEFYVLDARGEVSDLPARLRVGESESFSVTIVSHEMEEISYLVEVLLEGTSIASRGPIRLASEEEWQAEIAFPRAGSRLWGIIPPQWS